MTLNRPEKLNALTLQMVRELTAALRSVHGVVTVLDGAGRAFCAGGDVASVRAAGLSDNTSLTRDFFFEEYRLNELLARVDSLIPQVSLWDGITMGGGVGVSIHGRFRVATENTLFAKPETNIGLFPDVGASHFLGAMPGSTGEYIALTGQRLKPADLLYSGLATHFVSSALLEELKTDLSMLPTPVADPATQINAVLGRYASRSPQIDPAAAFLAQHREVPARVCSAIGVSPVASPFQSSQPSTLNPQPSFGAGHRRLFQSPNGREYHGCPGSIWLAWYPPLSLPLPLSNSNLETSTSDAETRFAAGALAKLNFAKLNLGVKYTYACA
jgi:enoyl-CoA hydratase/carnithine racemase